MLPALLPLLSLVPSVVECFTGDDAKDKSIGEKLLDVAETVTGSRDPETAAEALKNDPALLVQFETRCREIELEFFREETKRIGTVNKTMQTEAKSEDPWTRRWRPFWGFSSAVAFLFVCGLCCWLAFDAVASRDAGALKMIPEVVAAFATLFAIPGAILGVASWHRGKKQRVEAGESSGLVSGLAGKLFGGSK
jgi:hypothetical protein